MRVAIIIGSERDMLVAKRCTEVLDKLSIPYEVKVLSAHRTPELLDRYLKETDADVFIGMAGLAAHLPGYIASRTTKPVIGVPLNVKLEGIDAFLSMVQMPRGVPVGTVGVDNGENAAWLAARILALKDPELQKRLAESR
ncbi:MAG: 5-(carboxyamino)imidazole ribonucleotide mutase [Candidatus Bathyarchaeia archaeon]